MKQHLDFLEHALGPAKSLFCIESQIKDAGFDQRMLELVKIRTSQINGCA